MHHIFEQDFEIPVIRIEYNQPFITEEMVDVDAHCIAEIFALEVGISEYANIPRQLGNELIKTFCAESSDSAFLIGFPGIFFSIQTEIFYLIVIMVLRSHPINRNKILLRVR